MKKYPKTLSELRNTKRLAKRIKDMLEKLHNMNIFHGDVHEENIVYDPVTDDLRIIDFGLSKQISEITDADLELYYPNVEREKYTPVNALLQAEIEEVDFITSELDKQN